jgi:galactose oxidase-like protein
VSVARFLVAGAILLVAAATASNVGAADIRPNAWTPMHATGDGPDYGGLTGRRGWIQVAYDPVSKTIVMFGGDADTYRSDLWQYDFVRNRWHQVRAHPDPHGPCRRDMHNFVYDPLGKRFWMWNGSVGGNSGRNAQPGCAQYQYLQDQWTYDPAANTWTRQGANPDRMLAAGGAYDPVSRTMVQFGGDRALSSNSTDWTLVMDAATGQWTKLANLSPSPPPSVNVQGAFVYMPNVKKFLLFGGRNGSGTTVVHGQTWLFDPARRKWEQVSPPASPQARDLHSMVFDEANGVVILHGGRSADRQSAFADTWIFDPLKGTWTDITPLLSDPGPPMRYGTGVYDPVNKVMIMVPGEWGYDTYAFRYRPDALSPRAPSSAPPSKSR